MRAAILALVLAAAAGPAAAQAISGDAAERQLFPTRGVQIAVSRSLSEQERAIVRELVKEADRTGQSFRYYGSIAYSPSDGMTGQSIRGASTTTRPRPPTGRRWPHAVPLAGRAVRSRRISCRAGTSRGACSCRTTQPMGSARPTAACEGQRRWRSRHGRGRGGWRRATIPPTRRPRRSPFVTRMPTRWQG